MAIAGPDTAKEFLEKWGIDTKNLVRVSIHFELNDIVRVKTEYLFDGDDVDAKTILKEYALVELKNE